MDAGHRVVVAQEAALLRASIHDLNKACINQRLECPPAVVQPLSRQEHDKKFADTCWSSTDTWSDLGSDETASLQELG